MAKPTRTAEELHRLVLERIERLPGLAGIETDLHRGGVVGTESEGDGAPNWTVRTAVPPSGWRLDVARAIREVQNRFDLCED